MDAAEIDLIAREVDALSVALETERARHVAGVEPEPALARLFAAHGQAAHKQTVATLREAGAAPLAARVAALRAERAAAEDEEAWRAAEAKASAAGPDGVAPVATLELAALRERDPARRRALARAIDEALAPAAALREAAVEKRARARAEVGLAPDWRAVVDGDQALAASDDAWRDVLAFRAKADLGLAPVPEGDLARVDLVHLLALARWDGLFRGPLLAHAVQRTLPPLGLDPARLRVDAGARPGQWPGVHVLGARIVFRARGGAGDWHDLLEAAGHAFAAAARPPHARDATFAAALGWLLGSLALEPRWLGEHAGVERRHAADVVRELALRRLLALRAGAAAFRVASEAERGLSGAAWRDSYRDALTAATGAAWEGARAARDADADVHRAALAGAGAGERLRALARERFDEDWWRNPRTGPWLGGLLAGGTLPEGDEDVTPARAARALAERLEGKAAT